MSPPASTPDLVNCAERGRTWFRVLLHCFLLINQTLLVCEIINSGNVYCKHKLGFACTKSVLVFENGLMVEF